MNLNKVYLIGRLTRDPDLKYTGSGTPMCRFGMKPVARPPRIGVVIAKESPNRNAKTKSQRKSCVK